MLLFNNSNMTPGICFILYQFSFSLFYLDIIVNVYYQEHKKKQPVTCFSWLPKMLAVLFILKKKQIICLISLGRKCILFRKRAIQRTWPPISPQRNSNQASKKHFLLRNYTIPVIYKRWWSTVWKESYRQKTTNTVFLSASSKTFLKYLQ